MNLFEAFKRLDALNEDTFSVDDAGIKRLADFQSEDDIIDDVTVYDVDAENEEELKDSYVGQVILDCCVCHSKLYKDKDDVEVSEDEELANISEECPYCFNTDGYKIIGEVAKYIQDDDEADFEKEDDKEKNDEDLDEACSKKSNKNLKEDFRNSDYRDAIYDQFGHSYTSDAMYDVVASIVDRIDDFNDEDEVLQAIDNGLIYYDDQWEVVKHYLKPNDIDSDKWYSPFAEEMLILAKRCATQDDYDESLNEDLGKDVGEYQKWVDYDMKKYGKISKKTNDEVRKAGLEIVKDNHGDYEVIANTKNESSKGKTISRDILRRSRKMKESVENISIETDSDTINVEQDDVGGINVTTQPKGVAKGETIVPTDIETEEEILADDEVVEDEVVEEEPIEESVEETEEEVDEIVEESLSRLGEKYLKRVYENVDSFKLTGAYANKDRMKLEGVIKFTSGASKKTSFLFESATITKDKKVTFLGENLNITKGNKAFTLAGILKNGKFIAESLKYDYKTRDGKGKVSRVSGLIR